MNRQLIISLIRKEIGVELDQTDPILSIGILHEKLLAVAVECVEEAGKRIAADLMASSANAMAASKQSAGRIITEATEFVVEQLRAAGAEMAATVLRETQAEVARAEAAKAGAVNAAWIAGGLSCVAMVAVCTLLLLMWGR
jgi:hypothetical protein